MINFNKINREEQESIICIDYYKKCLIIYTSKEITYKRLLKKLGNPYKLFYTNNKISGAKWEVPFSNKKSIKICLSRPLLIGTL